MREIKFRAWNNSHNTMEYDIQNDYDCILSCFGSFLNNEFWEVMQYTGLKDENGKEIYEGDIVEQIGWEGELYKVVFYDYGFKLYNLSKENMFCNSRYSELCSIHGFNIIGNIYKNPELVGD
ncbi:YopX family protein [Clostridium botulinum]|uniref:YopX family protein n=1 Tax=Clostridium botulinum TaxID=1491 RepID=UPI000773AA4B|nr:YopX family protein [Clostridium botulinum]